MAKYSSTIQYNIKTTLDSSGIAKLQSEIRNVENELSKMANKGLITDNTFKSSQQQINSFKKQLQDAFNPKLGLLDTNKLNKNLAASTTSLSKLQTAFYTAGSAGKVAFNDTLAQLGKIDTGVKNVSKTSEKMFNTIGNTVRWGVVASGFQEILNSAHQAVQYVQDLDTSLTNIMMVTDYNRQQMNEYAQSANEAAKALSSTTVAMTDATLVFAQQGYDLPQSQELAKRSTMLANASQQDTATTSDQITAYMNAFGIENDMDKLDKALDAWAEVANVSAADVGEIAKASQRSASTAKTVGVNMDQLNAQIATIESVTREAPENIGNALKTIYSRLADVSLGETLEDGVDLGDIAKTLQKVGVQTLDKNGQLRNVGDIMEDIMAQWDSMGQTNQAAVSNVVAGRYQLSRFQALMGRSDLYNQYLQSSENSEGTMQKMQDIYDESLQGRINKLQSTVEGVFNDIFNSSDFYGLVDALTKIVDLTDKWTNALGGGSTVLQGMAAVATKFFSNNIAGSINNFITNRQTDNGIRQNAQADNILLNYGGNLRDINSQYILSYIKATQKVKDSMNDEEIANSNSMLQNLVNNINEQEKAQQRVKEIIASTNLILGDSNQLEDDIFFKIREQNGQVEILKDNYSGLTELEMEFLSKGQEKLSDLYTGDKDSRGSGLSSVAKEISTIDALLGKSFDDFNNYSERGISGLARLKTQFNSLSKNFAEGSFLQRNLPVDEFSRISELLLQLGEQLDNFDSKSDKAGQDFNEMRQSGMALGEALSFVTEVTAKANDQLAKGNKIDYAKLVQQLDEATSQMDHYRASTESAVQVSQGLVQQATRKDTISHFVNIAGSLGQIAISIQSIQSLGDIWKNTDISTGEKIEDTVVNLLTNLPMAASGILSLTNDVKKLSESLKELGVYSEVLSSIKNFSVGAGVLAAPIAALTAMYALGKNAQKQNQEIVEDTQKSLDEAKEKSDKAISDYSGFDELYKQYKQTGEASDEFKDKANEVAESLGTNEDKALAAAGAYDELAQSLRNAADIDIQNTIDNANQALNLDNQENSWISENQGVDKNTQQIISALSADPDAMIYGLEDTGIEQQSRRVFSRQDKVNDIQQTKQQLADTQAELDKLGTSYDDYIRKTGDASLSEQDFRDKTTELNNQINSLNDKLNSDAVKNFTDNLQTAADATVKLSSFQDSLSNAGTDVNKIKDVFFGNQNLNDYLNTNIEGSGLQKYYNQLSYMISSVTDKQQKMALSGEQAVVKAQQLASQQGVSADTIRTQMSYLSDEDKVKLVATLDESTSFDNFEKVIADFEMSDAATVSLDAELDTTDLKKKAENKSNITDLTDKYASLDEDTPGFTEDEVVDMAVDHPEYLRFLQQEGDYYVLNEQALQALNLATEQQSDALDELTGKTEDFSAENQMIAQAMSNPQEYGLDEDDLYSQGFSSLEKLNDQISNGTIDNADFLSGVNDQVDAFTQKIDDSLNSLENFGQGFQDAGIGAQNFAGILANELSGGLSQLNELYNSGEINIAEYADRVMNMSDGAEKLAAQTSGLSEAQVKAIGSTTDYDEAIDAARKSSRKFTDIVEDGIGVTEDQTDVLKDSKRPFRDYEKNTDEASDTTEDLTDAQKDGVRQLVQYNQQSSRMNGVQQFTHDMVDQYDALTTVFDDSGQVLQSVQTEMGGIQSQYEGVISNLANSAYNYLSTNEDVMNSTMVAVQQATGMTWDAVTNMFSSEENLEQGMMNSASATSAIMQNTSAEAQAAVSGMVSGITGLIDGIVAKIQGTQGSFTSEIQPQQETTTAITATGNDGSSQELGQVHIPQFTMSVKGSAQSGAGSSASNTSMTDYRNSDGTVSTHKLVATGNFSQGNTNEEGSAWYNPSGIWQEYKDAETGESHWRAASSDDWIGSSVQKIVTSGQSLAHLYGSGSASKATPKSSYPGYSLPKSSGGSGGKGKGGSNGGKGNGGNGGSGSGSGKTYDPKQKEYEEDEVDRYERVNTLLDDVDNKYERLNKDRERRVGFDMSDQMEKEIKLLNKEIDLENQKLEIQKQEASELQDQLSSQYGITFDSEGFIENYASVHDKLLNDVNSLIDQYNATTTQEGQESLEKQIDAAKDKLDKFNDTYKRYDELWAGDLQETINKLEDLQDQIEDIRIEMMKTQVEAADNIKDLNETLNDFNNTLDYFGEEDNPLRDMELASKNLAQYLDVANEHAEELYDTIDKRIADRLSSGELTADQKKNLEDTRKMYQDARDKIGQGSIEAGGTGLLDMQMLNGQMMLEQLKEFQETGTSSIFGEDEKDLYDVAKDVFDDMTSMVKDYEDEWKKLHDAISDWIDKIGDKISDRQDQYTAITDELEHQENILELIHGEEAYDMIDPILQAQNENYKASINEMKQTLDYWKEMQKGLKEGSDEWKTVNENIKDTQESLNDLVEDSLDNLQKRYENAVNNITNKWYKSIVGNDSDWASEQWELVQKNAEQYLDDVNKAYEIQKLQSKYVDLLNNADGLHTQQKITAQMNQQLQQLRDKTKLSKYDVDYANAQLEILQKQIALEDAQRNKSQMKLRRDTQGNYNYVYTANEDDVASAQNDLADATNNAYNLTKENYADNYDNALSAMSDYYQAVIDIQTNASLSAEEKAKRMEEIQNEYTQYLQGCAEQMNTSEQNMLNDFIAMVDSLVDENKQGLDDIYDQIKQGNIDAYDVIDERWNKSLTGWVQNLDKLDNTTAEAFAKLEQNAQDYASDTDEIANEVQQNWDSVTDAIQGAKDKTDELASSTSDFISQLKSDAGVVQNYEGTIRKYADAVTDANNQMAAYRQQVNDLQNKLVAKEQENANLQAIINGTAGSGGSSGAGNNGTGDLSDGAQVGDVVGFNGRYFYDSWGKHPAGSKYSGVAAAVIIDKQSNTAYGGIHKSTGDYGVHIMSADGKYPDLGWVKPSQLFDTGGYTGTWSNGDKDAKNGKVAYLHQKELVLNATDTENILKAVDTVRKLADIMKSSAMSQNLGDIVKAMQPKEQSQKIDQEVHITAEFPNANSATEIQEALLSLNESALQYSYRTK